MRKDIFLKIYILTDAGDVEKIYISEEYPMH